MDTIEAPKPGKLLPRLTAALLFVIGAYIILADLQALWNMLIEDDSFSFFIMFFIATSFVFGIYLFRLGIQTWSKINANIVRQISIVAAINIWIYASSFIPESFHSSDKIGLTHTITMSAAGILYLIICRFLFKLFKTQRTPVSKGLTSFFSLYLFSMSLSIITLPSFFYMTLMEEKKGHGHDTIGSLIIFPLSIIVAVLFYKWCMRYMQKNGKPKPSKEITPQLSQ
ncbi:MAG: hypothetical protein K9M75_09955 [Phycisphaerae bacterium]|nr:hypothetical protein [Phycisphaerae bacterium]